MTSKTIEISEVDDEGNMFVSCTDVHQPSGRALRLKFKWSHKDLNSPDFQASVVALKASMVHVLRLSLREIELEYGWALLAAAAPDQMQAGDLGLDAGGKIIPAV